MIVAFLAGVVVALLIQRVGITRFDRVVGFGLLEDFEAPKTVLVAVGVSSLLFLLEFQLGWAVLNVKPLIVAGVIGGGILFGAGMAVLGYCPGTMPMALGEGSLDAGAGMAGGLLAGLAFTEAYPRLAPLLGPDLGDVNLYARSPGATWGWVSLFAVACLAVAFLLDRQRPSES